MDAKIPALKVQVSNALNWDHLEGCVFGEAATKSNPKETKTNCQKHISEGLQLSYRATLFPAPVEGLETARTPFWMASRDKGTKKKTGQIQNGPSG